MVNFYVFFISISFVLLLMLMSDVVHDLEANNI